MRWIDTQCHLDFPVFKEGRCRLENWIDSPLLEACILTSVGMESVDTLPPLCRRWSHLYYTVGVHPLWVGKDFLSYLQNVEDIVLEPTQVFQSPSHFDGFERFLEHLFSLFDSLKVRDPSCIGIGEVGLDFYESWIRSCEGHKKAQQCLFQKQLEWAKQWNCPVIVHCRKAHDEVIAMLKKIDHHLGTVHAFNGSIEQARRYLDLGFKLGFGGAMTYSGARRLHALARFVPDDGYVLETDAPDLPPSWLSRSYSQEHRSMFQEVLGMDFSDTLGINSSLELPRIAQYMAFLKQSSIFKIHQDSQRNAKQVFRF